jgi:hypothetical protein
VSGGGLGRLSELAVEGNPACAAGGHTEWLEKLPKRVLTGLKVLDGAAVGPVQMNRGTGALLTQVRGDE